MVHVVNVFLVDLGSGTVLNSLVYDVVVMFRFYILRIGRPTLACFHYIIYTQVLSTGSFTPASRTCTCICKQVRVYSNFYETIAFARLCLSIYISHVVISFPQFYDE